MIDLPGELRLLFRGDLDWQFGLALAAAAAGLVAMTYYRETRSLGGWASWGLPTLRALSVILVILILIGPEIERRRPVGTRGQVTFVVDRSDSMHVADGPQGRSRLQQAEAMLDGPAGLLRVLEDTHETVVIEAEGNEFTDLAAALQIGSGEVREGNRDDGSASASPTAPGTAETPPAASNPNPSPPIINTGVQPPMRTVVLLSDGQNTRGSSPVAAAETLSRGGVAVSTVGLGSLAEPESLAILDLRYPAMVRPGNRVRGSIEYKRVMAPVRPVSLRVLDDQQQIVWEQILTPTAPSFGNVPFEFAIPEPESATAEPSVAESRTARNDRVAAEYRAQIVPLDASGAVVSERVTTQDSAVGPGTQTGTAPAAAKPTLPERTIAITVSSHQYRVLIVDGRSRWETRYLKNLFDRDPDWQTTTVIAGPGTPHPDRLPKGPGSDQFPVSADALADFDLVILGEVMPRLLDAERCRWFVEYVDRGGGMVLIDGPRDHLQRLGDDALQALMPVRWVGSSRPVLADSLQRTTAGRTTAWLDIFDPTAEGSSSEALSPPGWDALKAPHQLRPTRALADAETLIEAAVGSSTFPLIVTRKYGGGRVMYLAAAETWRWRWGVADLVHSRFWNQAALQLTLPPLSVRNDVGALDSGLASYQSGDRSALRVRLRNADGRFSSNATVQVVLSRDGREVERVPLRSHGSIPGLYQGDSQPLTPGTYTTQIIASGYGPELANLSTRFTVVPADSEEGRYLSQNRDLLESIAAAGDGRYVEGSDSGELLEYLRQRTRGRIERTRRPLWDSYFWFLPLVGLLGLEWWIRKRVGLA